MRGAQRKVTRWCRRGEARKKEEREAQGANHAQGRRKGGAGSRSTRAQRKGNAPWGLGASMGDAQSDAQRLSLRSRLTAASKLQRGGRRRGERRGEAFVSGADGRRGALVQCSTRRKGSARGTRRKPRAREAQRREEATARGRNERGTHLGALGRGSGDAQSDAQGSRLTDSNCVTVGTISHYNHT